MPYTPISGKFGSILIGATSHRLKQWSIPISSEMRETTALGSTVDADGNVWRTFMAGLNGATVSVQGIYDSGNAPMAAAAFRPGLTVTLTLGLAVGITLTVSAIVNTATPSTDVAGDAGFSAELTVNGPVTYPS